jgi:hypothetical protein
MSLFPFLLFKVCYFTTHGIQSKLYTKLSCVGIHLSPPVLATCWLWNVSNISPNLDLHFCDSFVFYTCGRLRCALEINVDQLLTDSLPSNAVSFPLICALGKQGSRAHRSSVQSTSCYINLQPSLSALFCSQAANLHTLAVGYVRERRNGKYRPYTESVGHKTWRDCF